MKKSIIYTLFILAFSFIFVVGCALPKESRAIDQNLNKNNTADEIENNEITNKPEDINNYFMDYDAYIDYLLNVDPHAFPYKCAGNDPINIDDVQKIENGMRVPEVINILGSCFPYNKHEFNINWEKPGDYAVLKLQTDWPGEKWSSETRSEIIIPWWLGSFEDNHGFDVIPEFHTPLNWYYDEWKEHLKDFTEEDYEALKSYLYDETVTGYKLEKTDRLISDKKIAELQEKYKGTETGVNYSKLQSFTADRSLFDIWTNYFNFRIGSGDVLWNNVGTDLRFTVKMDGGALMTVGVVADNGEELADKLTASKWYGLTAEDTFEYDEEGNQIAGHKMDEYLAFVKDIEDTFAKSAHIYYLQIGDDVIYSRDFTEAELNSLEVHVDFNPNDSIG